MPLSWSVESEERLVTIVADGNVGRAELDALVDALIPTGTLAYAKLFDGLRGTTAMSTEDIMTIGVRFRGLEDSHTLGPLAVVVPSDKFDVVARLLGILAAAKRPLRVFDNVTAARRWLLSLRAAGSGRESPKLP